MSPNHILRRLAQADRAWMQTRSFERLLRSVKYLCAGLLLMVGLDLVFQLTSHIRLSLVLLAGLSVLILLLWHAYRAFIKRSPLLRIARHLEERDHSLGSKLVNVLQLAETAGDASAQELTRMLARRAVDQASDDLTAVKFIPLTKSPTMKRTAWLAALPVLLVLIPAVWFAPVAWREILRFADPFGDHPPFSMTHLAIVSPAADGTEIVYKKSISIEAEFAGHRPDELFLKLEDPARPDKTITVPMFPAGEKKFVQQIDEVTTDLAVRAQTKNGRSISQGRHIKVLLTPQIEKSTVTIQPPAYTKLPPRETTLALTAATAPNLSALKGSTMQFRIVSNRPLSRGAVELQGAAPSDTAAALEPGAGEEQNTVSGTRKADESGRLRFVVKDVIGLSTARELLASLTVTHDLPPDINITEPAADGFIVDTYATKVAVRSSDDYGLKTIRIHTGLNDHYSEPKVIEAQVDPPQRDSVEAVRIAPSEMGAKPGDVITVFADATDTRPETQMSRSRTLRLEVISEEDYNDFLRMQTEIADLEAKYGRLHDEMKRLAQEQRELAQKAKEAKNADQAQRDELAAKQNELNTQLEKLADQMTKATRDKPLYDLEKDLQKVLNEEAQAVRDSVAQNKKALDQFASANPSFEGMKNFSKEGQEQAERLDPAAKKAEKEIADALKDAQQMQELLKSLNAFQQAYEAQKELAAQTAAYRSKKDLTDEDRLALQNMAGTERQIGETLEEITKKLREDADKAQENYPEAAQDAREIADAIEKANLPPLADTSAKTMLTGRGAESHDRAEHLRSEMEKLMSQCGDCQGGACKEFNARLKLMRSMMAGDTFSQMSQCRKFGFGKNPGGAGMGSGGMMAMGTSQPGQQQSLLGGESMLGHRQGGQSVNSSNAVAQMKSPPGAETAADATAARTGINAETTASTSLNGEAALDDYRAVVDAYFRRLTLNKDQKP
ncbi:MAG TPA: DUF4175 family protein [Verrucomicrobiales bacterium]|nr:DUF4175 family protein [Verrucomicrobiales bacterium]